MSKKIDPKKDLEVTEKDAAAVKGGQTGPKMKGPKRTAKPGILRKP